MGIYWVSSQKEKEIVSCRIGGLMNFYNVIVTLHRRTIVFVQTSPVWHSREIGNLIFVKKWNLLFIKKLNLLFVKKWNLFITALLSLSPPYSSPNRPACCRGPTCRWDRFLGHSPPLPNLHALLPSRTGRPPSCPVPAPRSRTVSRHKTPRIRRTEPWCSWGEHIVPAFSFHLPCSPKSRREVREVL